ncbi:MAG TPA: zf-HC2 domain-containing protein [Bryobacteraceae bacterium]
MSHLTDQELLLAIDRELPAPRAALVARHLTECPSCSARKSELEQTLAGFLRFHQERFDPLVPPPAGRRALLKARLAESAPTPQPRDVSWKQAAAVLVLALVAIGAYQVSRSRPHRVSLPEHHLTPGAIATADRAQVCDSTRPKNRDVPRSLQRRVFEEYGISPTEPQSYEVDYLITPALGGADDIRNLWPQSYSATVWNARVKDTLEDFLREQVCSGHLDLAAAQRDISANWIAAYRKYFHTDKPLEHAW